MTIHPFTPDDYPALAEVYKAKDPGGTPTTAQELRFADEHWDPKCRLARWLAEQDGRVVGFGQYSQNASAYHPRKFEIDLAVHPGYQGQGIGRALYDHVIRALRPFDPLAVHAGVREDVRRGVTFLADRGFREAMREWESRLDVAAFDPAPYSGLDEKLRAQGIEIKTLAELEADPERDRKLYELNWQVDRDMPHTEPPTRMDYDTWIRGTFENPGLLPQAYVLAVHDGNYVGISNLWRNQSNDDLDTGTTGVVRAYRRRGIATALKMRAILYAKAHGHPTIKTWNASTNEGMLAINERLGFVKGPAWINFVKVFKEEG